MVAQKFHTKGDFGVKLGWVGSGHFAESGYSLVQCPLKSKRCHGGSVHAASVTK